MLSTHYWIGYYLKFKKNIRKLYWYNLFCPRLYTSIYNTPAYIWEEYQSENNSIILLDLIQNPNRRNIKWAKSDKILNLLQFLYEQSIEAFPPKKYLKNLELRKKISVYRWKAINEGKRALRTKATLLEMQLKDVKERVSIDFYKTCMDLGIASNSPVDSRAITIFEFNKSIEILSKENGKK